jgi:hypothetical protein
MPAGRAEVLCVGEGWKEKEPQTFWRWFGKLRARQNTHAVLDIWQAFRRTSKLTIRGW